LAKEGEFDEKEKKRFHCFGMVGIVNEKKVVFNEVNLRVRRFDEEGNHFFIVLCEKKVVFNEVNLFILFLCDFVMFCVCVCDFVMFCVYVCDFVCYL
jgi:hypothetical protein